MSQQQSSQLEFLRSWGLGFESNHLLFASILRFLPVDSIASLKRTLKEVHLYLCWKNLKLEYVKKDKQVWYPGQKRLS